MSEYFLLFQVLILKCIEKKDISIKSILSIQFLIIILGLIKMFVSEVMCYLFLYIYIYPN